MPRTLSRDIGNASLRVTSINVTSANIDSAFYEAALTGLNRLTVAAWVKVPAYGANHFIWGKRSGSSPFVQFALYIVSSINIRMRIVNEALNDVSASTPYSKGQWFHAVGRYDGSNVSIWINGVKMNEIAQTGNILNDDNQHRLFSLDTGITTTGPLLAKNMYLWADDLSDAEILALYTDGTVPSTGLLGAYTMENGTGNLTDSSGNGNTGTLTNLVYTHDTPMKHKTLADNLVWNGDFEYAPSGGIATTQTTRYVDGTAAGAVSNTAFGWMTSVNFTAGSALFDTVEKRSGSYSLKIDVATGTAGTSGHTVSTTITVSPPIANQIALMIPLKPNTAYTLRGWIKTSGISNLNGGGARLRILEYSGTTTSSVASSSGSFLTGTNDWTQQVLSFTTNANGRWGNIWCSVFDENGIAWFDDITLTEDAPNRGLATRTGVSGTTPSAIANQILWFKADSLSLNDGDAVATWNDSSTVANNATQSTPDSRPTYKTSILNGQPVVRFDGTDDQLDLGAASGLLTQYTFIFVAKPASIASQHSVISNDIDGFNDDFMFGVNPGTGGVTGRYGAIIHQTSDSTTIGPADTVAASTTDFAIVAVTYDLNVSKLYKNRQLVATLTKTGMQARNDAYRIGAAKGTATRRWNGDIAEIIAYSRALTNTELDGVQTYLANKYNVATFTRTLVS